MPYRFIKIGAIIGFALAVLFCAGLFYFSTEPGKSINIEDARESRGVQFSEWYRNKFFTEKYRNFKELIEAMLAEKKIIHAPVYFDSLDLAKKLLKEGTFFVDRRGPLQRFNNINWGEKSHGRYYATQLHGLVGITPLLKVDVRLSLDEERRVGRLIANWIESNLQLPGLHRRAWYEGTVVKRLSVLLHALNYIRKFGPIEDLDTKVLVYTIVKHKEYLLSGDGIYSFGNHGLRQDIALLSVVAALPTLIDKERIIETVKRRLAIMEKKMFTPAGIWKEHAPGYVHYILRFLYDIRDVLEDIEGFEAKNILCLVERNEKYLVSVLTPEGEIPPIGKCGIDSIGRAVLRRSHLISGSSIEFYQRSEDERLILFPGYGQAVYRENRRGVKLYFLLQASQNLPAGKRHEDALSFLIKAYGRWWFIDGGHMSYEKNEVNDFLESAYAHSTYVLDDDLILPEDSLDLKVKLYEISKDGEARFVVVAESERYLSGGKVKRHVRYDAERMSYTIKDSFLGGGASPRWRGFLQMAPDLQIRIEEEAKSIIATDRKRGLSLRASIEGSGVKKISLHRGEKSPLLGWAVWKGDLVPSNTISYTNEGIEEVSLTVSWAEHKLR